MNNSESQGFGDQHNQREIVDLMFDGHLETPLLKMTVQQRLDWIDEMMRLRTEWTMTAPSSDAAREV